MHHQNRRIFIKNAATASVGAFISPVIISSCTGKKSPSDKLNIAFIGAGGKGMHAANPLATGHASLATLIMPFRIHTPA